MLALILFQFSAVLLMTLGTGVLIGAAAGKVTGFLEASLLGLLPLIGGALLLADLL